jgi:hypothetical protein
MMMERHLNINGVTIKKAFGEGFSCLLGVFGDVDCSGCIFGRKMPIFG